MADEQRPASGTTIQRPAAQTPAAGVGSQGVNPQNLNRSPSPGGDGVQSSQSERTAAGLDRTTNQPGQQRVNAAERREAGERTQQGDRAGIRAGIVQSPGEVLPGEASDAIINASEQARRERLDAEHEERFGHLPQATLDEMDAGRNALKRHNRATSSDGNKA